MRRAGRRRRSHDDAGKAILRDFADMRVPSSCFLMSSITETRKDLPYSFSSIFAGPGRKSMQVQLI